MNTKLITGAGLLLTLGHASPAPATIVTNGSFEEGVVLDGYRTVLAGDAFVRGWEVFGTSIDVLTSPRWTAASGVQSLDLAGTPGVGGVRQWVATEPGSSYLVRFALSRNDEGEGDKTVLFSWGSQTEQLLGGPQGSWSIVERLCVATDPATLISFASPEVGLYGGTLDDVSVTAVPAPASVFPIGIAALAARRRRRGTR